MRGAALARFEMGSEEASIPVPVTVQYKDSGPTSLGLTAPVGIAGQARVNSGADHAQSATHRRNNQRRRGEPSRQAMRPRTTSP